MAEDETEEWSEGGLGAAFLSFIVGLLIPIFFNSFVWGQGAVVFFLVLVALGGVLLYGASMLSMPSGVSLGVGVVMASTAAMSWWLAGLGTGTAALALARYAHTDQLLTQLETEELTQATGN